MNEPFRLDHLDQDDRQVEARVHVPVDCLFFRGHFPEEPILPGVAQVVLVTSVLRRVAGGPLRVQAIRRVKFTSPVRPGMDLALRLVLEGPKVLWRLAGPQGEVSSGEILVHREDP
ncbi:hypothetical protein KBD49_05420 [Myxococcota bacterium]|jgi:3-hydroxymyristoyl/3-hydroxydecanoyl-(acyl carrier protein) dehydratase|nr:hypothetical protein [Myxococcota bacterium]